MKKDLVFIDMVKDQKIRTSKTVKHLTVFFPNKDFKIDAIGDMVMCYGGKEGRSIVFTDTKREANDISLKGNLKLDCEVLHGDIP